MVDNNGAHYLQFNHGGSSPASFIIRPQPNTLKCSDIYKCKKPCDGKWTLVNNPAGTIMTQLSCSNTHVYGVSRNHLKFCTILNHMIGILFCCQIICYMKCIT